ncbi:PEP-utilizing enzyme [Erythrobacter sp.]|uniref:PEP-utilizing enzyme n=1 Tax=Erythrobacter sp. TaxID=1042 RepID=UPI001B16314B|nr:PEP-utilizing enzyme [Erythrobacter sp.]MBO6525421.1 hypothetical protein [Erythrobacter sp.]MBO6529906.1 hypothetical protein [Erythrobacter sp.]
MKPLPTDDSLWGGEPDSPLVAAVHLSVRDLVRRRFTQSGLDWDAFVAGPIDDVITKEDVAAIDAAVLATGHLYGFSATISAVERPDAYQGLAGLEGAFDHPDAPSELADADGKALCGVGDNVVQGASDIQGVALYVRSAAQVIALMEKGVPEGSIAIIDDSGGTLTAPILDRFSGLLCAGGTVRSHLGILAREYGIPCLMNVRLSGVAEGDRILLETTAAARTADSYLSGTEMPARVWRLS